jgi:hypothetical protein
MLDATQQLSRSRNIEQLSIPNRQLDDGTLKKSHRRINIYRKLLRRIVSFFNDILSKSLEINVRHSFDNITIFYGFYLLIN